MDQVLDTLRQVFDSLRHWVEFIFFYPSNTRIIVTLGLKQISDDYR